MKSLSVLEKELHGNSVRWVAASQMKQTVVQMQLLMDLSLQPFVQVASHVLDLKRTARFLGSQKKVKRLYLIASWRQMVQNQEYEMQKILEEVMVQKLMEHQLDFEETLK